MFELSIEQIKMVSGGAVDQSGNDYGDSSNNKNDIKWTNRQVGEPGLISTATSIAGGAFGAQGSAIGFLVGHYIETRDYHQIGENHKRDIDKQLQNGLFHND